MTNEANKTKVIAAAVNAADGIAAEIAVYHKGGFSVALKDTDAGEYLPTVKVFADYGAAVAYAEAFAGAAVAEVK